MLKLEVCRVREPDKCWSVIPSREQQPAVGKGPMQLARYPIFERIGKMLHDQLDDIAHEPLPESWTDMINYLNNQERGQAQSVAPGDQRAAQLAPIRT